MRARIFKYDVEKGYGFLVEENNTRHFFHVTNCHGFVPQIGLVVTFQVGEGRRGPAALNIRLIPVAPVVPVAPDTSAVELLAGDKSEVSRG
jgi:cold shock CspA family protein